MSKDKWKKLSKNESKKWLGVVGRMLLAYALVFAPSAWAAQNQATKDKAGSPQKAADLQDKVKQSARPASTEAQNKQAQGEESESAVAEEKPSHDGSHEGIKVHGHWTIEVRNPDGSLVTHREFENSLTPSTGASLLTTLLNSGGNALTRPFNWGVRLGGGGCQPFPPLPDGTTFASGNDCVIAQNFINTGVGAANTAIVIPAQSVNLTASISGGSFVLTGSVQVSTSTVVTSVATETIGLVYQSCIANPPSPCAAIPINQFTSKPLDGLNGDPQAVSVSSGQTIGVTVNISFS